MLKVTDLVPGDEVLIENIWGSLPFCQHPPFYFERKSNEYKRDVIIRNSKGCIDSFSIDYIKRLCPESLPLESQIALKENELAVLKEKLHKEDWIEKGEILIGVPVEREYLSKSSSSHFEDRSIKENDVNRVVVFRARGSVSLSKLKSFFYKSLRRATPAEIASFEAFEKELKK